jgi:hypothetical protein
LYLALVHHPVRARDGSTITTAVTNLDVHDLARLARTYDLRSYFIVTPIGAQSTLVDRIVEHWRTGAGARRVPERGEALALVSVVDSIDAAAEAIEAREGRPPRLVATGARPPEGRIALSFVQESENLATTRVPTLLLFGTGHGLSRSVVERADAVLAPIRAGASYNHLSVRTAAAIILDRLIGESVDA